MSLQILKKAVSVENVDLMGSNVQPETLDHGKENRAVNLQSQSCTLPRPTQRTPPQKKRVSTEDALQAVKRMRDNENALSCKIIQNLQSDKAAMAQKMEEAQSSLSSVKQRCVALEASVGTLVAENEQFEGANQALQDQVEELQEAAERQASTISQLETELQQERARHVLAPQPEADVELLKLAKRYLTQTLRLRRAKTAQLRPISKSAWQSDSLVAQCNGCNKRFGTFLRRHHCRGCGKLFCSTCCQANLALSDSSEKAPAVIIIDGMSQLAVSTEQHKVRQRSCKACFKLAEEAESRKQRLEEQTKAELRAMEEWLARPEGNVEGLLNDSDAE